MIQHLGSDIVSELRSGVALTNISQCVEELVLNSLDAGSTCITVDVDICNASVDVSDNGTGIARSDLKSMGNRYFTSKCHSLRDLENAASYGYRGEAIASLSKVCEKLEIISRHKTSYRTFCKLARKGKYMGVYESTSPRSKHGTTVSAYGIFHMLPVRRKLMSSTIDLEQIRKKVVAIAIIHPEVSLMLRNKENSYTFFQTHRSVSVLSIMSQVFGCYKSKAFTPISDTFGSFKLSGYVSLEGHPNKNLQFFYLNKRLILKTKLHKVTNDMLSKGVSRTQADNPEPVLQQGNAKSPKSKTGDRYAGFVINLECPPSAYDITFDPAKTLVEFVKWDDPMLCLTQCLNEFLVKKGVVSEMATDDSATCVSSNIQDETNDCFKEVGPRQLSSQERFEAATTNANSNVDCQDEPACKKGISPSNMRWSLYSSTAKRKQEFEARENDGRKKSPRNCSTVSDKAIQIVKQTNKYDTCSYNDKDIANKSEITASTEAIFKCTPSTPISCCENLPTKRSSIYTVLQKFSRDSDNSLCKSSDDGRPKCTSSKYLLSYGSASRSSKSSNGTSRRPGVTNCRNVLTRRTAMDSLRKRTLDQNLINFNQELESREGQIMLQWQKGGTPSSIQKIKKYPEITKLREASKQISIDDEVSPLISPSPDSKDSPEGKVGDVKTAGDCKIDDDSKTVGVSIGDFRTLGGFRTENDSWAFGDSRTTDVTDSIIERGSRITDSVMIGGDSRMEGYSKIQNESEMAVNSGAKGGPGRALECNRSLPRACEPTQEINALSRRNSKEVILKDQSCDPENENSIGDDIISHDDNGATVANHDGDSKSVDPEWLCQYDSCREQQLYVNIRTGNTSLENPKHGVDTAKIVTSSKRSGQTRKLHPFALHLSHNFTPWLPRNEKCASDSEEIGTGVGVMLNNWVNPVFEGDGKVGKDLFLVSQDHILVVLTILILSALFCFKTIIGANSSTVSKNLVKVHSFLQPFNFTKECFKHLKVKLYLFNLFS